MVEHSRSFHSDATSLLIACGLCTKLHVATPLPPLQSWVVGMVLERFCTAAAEDLPGVARFLLQYGAPADGELKKVRLGRVAVGELA